MNPDKLQNITLILQSVHRRLGPAGDLIAVAAGASVLSMTFGVAALMNTPFWPAGLPIALFVLFLQLRFAHEAHKGGLVGRMMWLMYAGLAAFSMALSVGAMVNVFSADRVAQKAFATQSRPAFAQLDQVAAAYQGAAAALDRVAARAHAKSVEEQATGNTCGISIPGDNGPVFRLRKADDERFHALSAALAAKMQALVAGKTQAEAAIRTYTPARHAEVSRQIEAALDAARLAAADPTLADVRNQAQARLGQMTTGVIDGQTQKPVMCADPVLASDLKAVAAMPAPAAPTAIDLPRPPSHREAILGFVSHIAAVLGRHAAFDADSYGLPLLGVAPELALLLALAHRRRATKSDSGLVTAIAEAGGFPVADLAALNDIAARAAADGVMDALHVAHVEDRSRFGVVDYLRLPSGVLDTVAYTVSALVHAGYAIDLGVARAGDGFRTFTPAPEDPNAHVRIIRLKAGVWRRLMLETLRAAACAPKRPRHGDSDLDSFGLAAE